MTAPRQVLPEATYLVTRRCADRHFFLRPSALTNAIVLFVLAVAVRRFGIQLHAYCVMSNHLHLVLTDPEARLPAFMGYLDGLVSRAINAMLGREGKHFWEPARYSAVRLLDLDDVVDKIAYTLANPVEAGLVTSGRLWPGLWSAPGLIGAGPQEVPRPVFFFRKKGPLPERVELELTAPPGFASASQLRDRAVVALGARERELVRAAREAGRGFLGAERVLAQDPLSRPATEDPPSDLNPKIAGRDLDKVVAALAGIVDFVRSYKAALRKLREGVADVLFPAGTYLMRVAHGVACEAYG